MALVLYGYATPQEPPVLAAPVISGVPTISGTEQVGQTLTASPASVTGNPTPTRTWQWKRTGVAISGATASTYTLVAADETETITVDQIETNSQGSDTATSAATGAIGSGSVPQTAYSRDYTIDSGNETIDLSSIGPAEVGPATYLLTAYTGASLAAKTLTLDTDTIAAGTVTVRRTDDNGERDLVLTMTMTALSITASGSEAILTYGADTSLAKSFSVTITGGDYDGETVTGTFGDVNLASGEAFLGVAPVVALTTDADSDGQADASDVLGVTRDALVIYNGAFTAPALSTAWRDQVGALGDTDASYTAAGSEDTSIFVRQTAGGDTADSNAITVDQTIPVAFLANFEGADAATSYTEESDFAEAGTFTGSCALDTAQFKFGGASFYNFSIASYLSFTGHIAGRNDAPGLTIEWWRRHEIAPNSAANGRMIHCGGAFQIYETHTDTLTMQLDSNTTRTAALPAGTTSTVGVWGHYLVKLDHATNVLRVWFNGALIMDETLGVGLSTTPGALHFGNVGGAPGNGSDFRGWIDGVRIVNDLLDIDGTVPTEMPTLAADEARTAPFSNVISAGPESIVIESLAPRTAITASAGPESIIISGA